MTRSHPPVQPLHGPYQLQRLPVIRLQLSQTLSRLPRCVGQAEGAWWRLAAGGAAAGTAAAAPAAASVQCCRIDEEVASAPPLRLCKSQQGEWLGCLEFGVPRSSPADLCLALL